MRAKHVLPWVCLQRVIVAAVFGLHELISLSRCACEALFSNRATVTPEE